MIVVKPTTPATSQEILLLDLNIAYKDIASPITKYAICNVGSLINIMSIFPLIL